MDLSQARFERIVNLIYGTLEQRGGWRPVLECLHEAVGGRAIHLLAFDAGHGALSYSEGADMAPQIDLEYIQKYQFIDARVGLLRTMAPDAWLHCHEHFDDAFVAGDPFYQEFLIPHGARYLSACKLAENAEATVILACLRRPGEGAMPPDALGFLERLRPHLQRAVRLGLARFVYSAQALVGHALVDKLRQPVMLLTTTGEVVLANEAAHSLLGATSLVQVADGRLLLPQAYQRTFLDGCAELEHAVRSSGGREFRALHMSSEPDAAPDVLYGFFTLLAPERTLGSFGLRPLVMLSFYHPGSAQAIDATLLSAAFGLSHAECRVASHLADGMPPRAIAEKLGVQYDTVRKQLLSIYQKTATNRQPELVRLLMNLPASAVKRAVKSEAAMP
ncbi:helix-turn-helix transcriptional regulator [Massilia sp. G4R7]|uniref:Helix-turn-helix transcriptional regulator n=1 Tax=Massilia phyllostachyos TaxID=2898585 RepID=A0ABS8Q523_9BURK|nr:helix-turn-helix transcriptional regulator [Massilia phyllostachyos]MCD2516851.1 helix-turn-helix transcriptional regulator [Massilia phyllostachyos]